MTSPAAVLRRRRKVARYTDRLRSNDRLFDAARGLRREAQVYLNAGRPDLAQPYLDEATLFEDATQPVPGL
jgi:hypothetical protein